MSDAVSTIGAAKRVWRFQLAGDEKVWELPLVGSLNVKQAMTFRKLGKSAGDEDAMLDVAIELFDALCPGLVDALTVDQLGEVMRGWQDASGMAVGESRASSES